MYMMRQLWTVITLQCGDLDTYRRLGGNELQGSLVEPQDLPLQSRLSCHVLVSLGIFATVASLSDYDTAV